MKTPLSEVSETRGLTIPGRSLDVVTPGSVLHTVDKHHFVNNT